MMELMGPHLQEGCTQKLIQPVKKANKEDKVCALETEREGKVCQFVGSSELIKNKIHGAHPTTQSCFPSSDGEAKTDRRFALLFYLCLPDFLRKGPWGYFLVVLFAVGLFYQAVKSESDERDIRSVRM